MKLKTAIQSLSFAMVASVSSLASAQALGVGIDARSGVTTGVSPLVIGAQPGVAVQAGIHGNASGPQAAADANARSSTRVSTDSALRGTIDNAAGNVKSGAASAAGHAGAAGVDITQKAGAGAHAAANRSANMAAEVKADAHAAADHAHATAPDTAAQRKPVKAHGGVKAGAGATVKTGTGS